MNSQELIFKITRAKWTGVVGQTVESLLCKLQALSLKTPVLFSNPYTYTHTHTHTHTHTMMALAPRGEEREQVGSSGGCSISLVIQEGLAGGGRGSGGPAWPFLRLSRELPL
jgi:hypothetical protein